MGARTGRERPTFAVVLMSPASFEQLYRGARLSQSGSDSPLVMARAFLVMRVPDQSSQQPKARQILVQPSTERPANPLSTGNKRCLKTERKQPWPSFE
jgi:hypothetical protein